MSLILPFTSPADVAERRLQTTELETVYQTLGGHEEQAAVAPEQLRPESTTLDSLYEPLDIYVDRTAATEHPRPEPVTLDGLYEPLDTYVERIVDPEHPRPGAVTVARHHESLHEEAAANAPEHTRPELVSVDSLYAKVVKARK